MALRGYILKDINLLTRVFIFKKSESKNLIYKISYEGRGVKDINNSLKKEGWIKVVSKNRWMFSCNEKVKEEIRLNPSREGILRRNKVVKYSLFYISLFYFGIYLPIWMILGFGSLGITLKLFTEESVDSVLNSISWIYSEITLYPIVYISIFFIVMYTVFKVNKLDKGIRNELGYNKEKFGSSVEISNNIKKIKRLKLAWSYAPDKIEKWLEDMESKGYNLYKVNKIGSMFYFTKGNTRKIKYIADYQNSTDESYYEIHKEDGWKLNFKSAGSVINWSIWSKEYDDIVPEIYTNNEDLLKYAKKTLIINTITLLPAIIMFTSLLCQDLYFVVNGLYPMYHMLIKIVVIIEFGVFYNSSLRYYFRLKKKIVQYDSYRQYKR